MIIALDAVGVRYGKRWVLQGISAQLGAGDVVHLAGPNGAGKSSLLRVLAGVQEPSSGTVAGRPPDVAWLPDRFPRRQAFTVAGYLSAQARMRGLSGRAVHAAVAAQVERFHLTEMTTTRLRDLSKGSAQKVGLAQSLLVPPRLLLLDEPWSGLDAMARSAVPEVVREVGAAGGTVVLTDHHGYSGVVPTRRWIVADGRLDEIPAGTVMSYSRLIGEGGEPLPQPEAAAIVEVLVADAAGAVALADELSVRGYPVRVREPGPAAGPAGVDPRAVDPRAVDPRAVDPRAVDPRVLDPGLLDPGVVDPAAAGTQSEALR